MACDLKQIQEDTFNLVKEIIKGNSTSIIINDKGRVLFDHTKSTKYTTSDAAYKVAEQKVKDITAWAEAKFGVEFKEGWLTVFKEGDQVKADYAFPSKLRKAYEQKIAWDIQDAQQQQIIEQGKKEGTQDLLEQLQNSDIDTQNKIKDLYGYEYNSVEEMVNGLLVELESYDDALGNTPTFITPNFQAYSTEKEKLLKKVKKTIDRLYTEKRIDNTKGITQKINKLNTIKESLEKDLDDFTKSTSKINLIQDFFNKDLAIIQDLLEYPTLENLFLAQDIFKFIKTSADTNNLKNSLFNPGGVNNSGNSSAEYSAEVQAVIDSINSNINAIQKKINVALDTEFLALLEKYEKPLTALYPEKPLEEIKEELLKKLQDIHKVESYLFTVDQNLISEADILGQLLRLEYETVNEKEKSKSQKLIQAIDGALPAIQKELQKLGLVFKTKLGTVYNYNWLYQNDDKGNTQPELISKFSSTWNKFIYGLNKTYNERVFAARQNKDWTSLEKALTDKYFDLNDKVDFVNFGLLDDIFDDPIYTEFKKGSQSEADAYKASIISTIGQEEYEELIERQKNYLDNFIEERNTLIQVRLIQEGVSNFDDLSDSVKNNLTITLERLNPASFINSHLSGNQGRVAYTIGTQTNEKPSYIKYNTYIPKAQTNTGKDTNFYDNRFSAIEQNPVMYDFWKIARQSLKTINENLIDSNLSLNKGSILAFKKSFKETLIDKSYMGVLKAGLSSFNSVKQFIKNQFSNKDIDTEVNEDITLPGGIFSFKQGVQNHFQLVLTDLANILDKQIKSTMVLDWNKISQKQKEAIVDLLGLEGDLEIVNLTTKGIFKVKDLKIFSQRKMFEQQTLNIPSMLKAQLELATEHKSRSVAKNKLDVILQKSREVLTRKNRKTTSENANNETSNKERINANKRNEFFFNNVVLNKTKDPAWGNISNELKKLANTRDGKILGNVFYKNYKPEEKKIYYSALKRLEGIEIELNEATVPSKITSLNEEKQMLENRISLLGRDYLSSAIFHAAFNKMGILVNMGYGITVAINNYFNGHMMLFNRDGEFWTKGNINLAWHFVTQNKTRFIRPKYKESWGMMGAFIKQLNIIQDGTNEIQRAEDNTSFLQKGILHPMYGTELVEWYNQVPGILSMAMDIEIAPGVPLFDGKTFPAHKLVNGVFTLKDEYRTPENIQSYEEISSESMLMWKLQVKDMIRSLNGDYSRTGVTRIKGGVIGKQAMQFKTWLPQYVSSRLAYKQKDLVTGKEKTGYLLSALTNPKTALSAGLLTVGTLAVGAMSGPTVVWMLPLIAPIVGVSVAMKMIARGKMNIDVSEVINIRSQLAYVAKATTIGLIETPINLVGGAFGKRTIIDIASGFKDKLTKQEAIDLQLLAKHMQFSLGILLMRFIIQNLIGNNDEDELKGKKGSAQRTRWEAQQKERAENKGLYNLLENFLTSRFQELNLANDPISLASTLGSKNGLENNMGKVMKAFANTAAGFFFPEDDIVLSGDNAGQSKAGNAWRKLILPSPLRGLGQDTWQLGFETWTQREWQNNDFTDRVFDSDYKEDKKELKNKRKKKVQNLTEEYEEENDVKIKDLEPEKQDMIEKKLKKKALKEVPNPKRKDYDEEQQKIEE